MGKGVMEFIEYGIDEFSFGRFEFIGEVVAENFIGMV